MTTSTATAAPRTEAAGGVRAWTVFAVVFLASVSAAMAQFCVPPLMPVLMREFGVDLAQAGGLMAAYSIAGVVLALPAGMVLARFGGLAVGVTAVASVVVGSALGALASDFTILLVSRAVQGVGVGLIGVAAPAVLAAVFPAERRGLPMGLWATWMPLAGLLMYTVAPRVAEAAGWQAVWWLTAGAAGVALVLYPPAVRGVLPGTRSEASGARAGVRAALVVPSVWLLGTLFMLNAIGQGTPMTFLPTYLATVHEYDLVTASGLTSLILLTLVIASPVAGAVSDRIGSRKLVYTVPALVAAVAWPVAYAVDPGMLAPLLLVIGLAGGAIPVAVFAAAPEVLPDPRLAPMAMAVVMLGQHVSAVIGPVVFGGLVEATSWMPAVLAMAGVTCVGAVVGWLVKVR